MDKFFVDLANKLGLTLTHTVGYTITRKSDGKELLNTRNMRAVEIFLDKYTG
jgi:hypothetical protein